MARTAVATPTREGRSGIAIPRTRTGGRLHLIDHADRGHGKATVRPLDRADLPQVKALLDSHLGEWGGDASLLASTLIDYPWADPEMPSLVAVGGERRIVGFLGVQVKRLRVGERTISGACASHFVVAPEHRRTRTGAALMTALLAGPQSATWTDCANERVVQMGRVAGGHIDHARAFDWMIAIRPLRWTAAVAAVTMRRRLGRSDLPVAAFPLQALRPGIVRARFPQPDTGVFGEYADAVAIASNLAQLSEGFELRVDYGEEYLRHLFAQVERARGDLTVRMVRRNGTPIGWYAYVPQSRRVTRVLHVAASPQQVEDVFAEMTMHAAGEGAAVLTGRAEPHLRVPLHDRYAVLGYARQPMFHSRDREVRAALGSSSALFTQLDAEWFVT